MQGAFSGFFLITVIALAGFVGAKFRFATLDTELILNRIAFKLATPALLFGVISQAKLEVLLSPSIVIQFIGIGICFLITFLILRITSELKFVEISLASAASIWVNANNIGLPISIYVLGDGSYVAPTILYQILVFVPVMLFILDSYTGGKPPLLRIIAQPFKNPITIASLLGLLVATFRIDVPEVIILPFEILGSAAIPMMLLALGIGLGANPLPTPEDKPFKGFWFIFAMKVVGFPLIIFLLAHFIFHLEGTELLAVILVSALPSAQNIYNFSSQYQIFVRHTRRLIFFTTIGSIPVILGLSALVS